MCDHFLRTEGDPNVYVEAEDVKILYTTTTVL